MDGLITIQRELPVVEWRGARLHVQVHMVVRDGDEPAAVTDVSESVTVDAIDDDGPNPRIRVRPKVPRR